MRTYRGNGFRVLWDVVRDQADPPGDRICASEGAARAFLLAQRRGIIPSEREAFVVILLNSRHRTIGLHVCSIGGLDTSPVHPREVFRPAIAVGAAALIAVHNHPSGDCAPSEPDRLITERLQQAGELLGIQLLDHLVIGSEQYYTFADGRHFPLPSC